jgi:hypothetical protein
MPDVDGRVRDFEGTWVLRGYGDNDEVVEEIVVRGAHRVGSVPLRPDLAWFLDFDAGRA